MDYVIIMGGGRVGLALANLLINEGYDITLIESDESLCGEVASELDALVVCGNGTNSKVLEEINIEDAEYFIATTGNDEANLLSCILVRKYNVPHIIARVSNPDHEEAFKEVGIEKVISPERAAASYLQKVVTRPNTAELMTIGQGDGEILDMTITNDKIIGKKFKDVSPTKDFIIIAAYQNKTLVIPQPDNIISRGEKVSVLVKRGTFKKVSKKLEKNS
ncbi:TrkA family potassium uptake protein [Methanobrevibacter sp.]|uniref:potassium channel family protein n=1 Tax=Methanobrevibacter sp. TaxID=66852 RepID=UPI0026E07BDF|nr:TrkA family potassium uptake protein [Methanobrevibacter sp.]MDO5824485.1 TrkA family potassium uptake protein [Methanobrevibacter sp.]